MIFADVTWNASFFVTSLLLGVALAMDAFSVSLASAFDDPKMKKRRQFLIAGTFAFFQALMPMIGWLCVHYLGEAFKAFYYAVPWIALVLLTFLGIKMIIEYHRSKNETEIDEKDESKKKKPFLVTLLIQGIATSIDALSVGFTTAKYQNFVQPLVCSLIIAVITFIICMIGLILGKTVGTKIGKKAILIGGIILIVIGVYICVTGCVKLYVPNELIPEWLKWLF